MRAQTRRGRSQFVKRRLSVEPLEERQLLSGLNLLASSPPSSLQPSESRSPSPQSYSYGGTLEQPASNQAKAASENPALQSDSKPAQAAEYQKPSVAESLIPSAARANPSGNRAIVLYDDRLSSRASLSSPKPGGQAAAAIEQPYFTSDPKQGIANYSTQDGGQQAYDESYLSQGAVYPSTNSARPQSPMPSSPEPAALSIPEGRQAAETLVAAAQAADAPKAQGQPALVVTVVRKAETSRLTTGPVVRAPLLANAEAASHVPRARTVERIFAPAVEDQPAVASPSAGL